MSPLRSAARYTLVLCALSAARMLFALLRVCSGGRLMRRRLVSLLTRLLIGLLIGNGVKLVRRVRVLVGYVVVLMMSLVDGMTMILVVLYMVGCFCMAAFCYMVSADAFCMVAFCCLVLACVVDWVCYTVGLGDLVYSCVMVVLVARVLDSSMGWVVGLVYLWDRCAVVRL